MEDTSCDVNIYFLMRDISFNYASIITHFVLGVLCTVFKGIMSRNVDIYMSEA